MATSVSFVLETAVYTNTVSSKCLWQVLEMISCTPRFICVIHPFLEGMMAQVIDSGDMSEKFGVSNGTKQGCVRAPLLFSIFFALMLMVAFKDCDFRCDTCGRMGWSRIGLFARTGTRCSR